MKSKILVSMMLLSLATSMIAFAMVTSPVRAVNENVKLSINPTTISKLPSDVNSFFDAYVDISDVTGLFGFDISVTWADNTLITLDAAASNTTTATILNGVWGAGNWFFVKSESGGGGGAGYFRIVALSTKDSFNGTSHIINLHFQIMRSCNFELETPIQISVFKLSDSHWTNIPATTTDGLFHISATTPDLELVLVDPYPNKPFGYCKMFEVKVYASHICAQLKDYDLTFQFTNELLKFVDVDEWGQLGDNITGQAGYESVSPGTIHVWDNGGATAVGDQVYLFALTFHIEFNDDISHIWRTNASHELDAHISIQNAELSFLEGTIQMSGITMPTPLTITVHLIRGDVDCNGHVDVVDLRIIAAYYDQIEPTKYDLTMDGTIDIFDLVVVATNFGYGSP